MTYQVPKNQILWEVLQDEHGVPKQIITSDEMRKKYFLYDVEENGKLTKIETGNTPNFEKRFIQRE